jgi:nucleoid DNA-binding protein
VENKKITLQELADAISAQSGSTKRFTDNFLRELVVVIQEYLEKDGMVKVKGLGTFKLLWIEARKSINVATKETIVLPAHYKLSFTPEENVKQEINAHISSFGGAEVLEGAINDAEQIEEESAYNETTEIVIKEIEVEEQELSTEESSEKEEILAEDASDEKNESIVESSAETPIANKVKETVESKPEKVSKPNRTLIAIIVILLLVILGLCVYIFYPKIEKCVLGMMKPTLKESNFEVVSTPKDSAVVEEVKDTIKLPVQDTIKVEVKDSIKETVKEEPIITVDNYNPSVAKNAPTREVVTVIDGSRLTMVAYRAYGHKAFWVYVYDANRDKLKSPSAVEKGMQLRIPDLPKSLVNSKDKRCLDKAYELAGKYDK